jgi:hypothetical protein
MTATFLAAVRPRTYKTAIGGDPEKIEEELLHLSDQEASLALIKGYWIAIQHNRGVTNTKGRLVSVGLAILTLIVASLVAMAFLG